MKLRQILCMMLVFAMVCILELNTSAFESYERDSLEVSVARASGRFSMEVLGNTTVKANSSFPLEAGETVTIKASYSPFSASVDFGLIAPDGLFYGLNTVTGSFDKAIRVNEKGYYTLAIRNNSKETVHVSGYVNY